MQIESRTFLSSPMLIAAAITIAAATFVLDTITEWDVAFAVPGFSWQARDAAYFAIRRLARLLAILANTLLSSLALCTLKYMSERVAHCCSSAALPSITRTV
jgi:hypothetical protein